MNTSDKKLETITINRNMLETNIKKNHSNEIFLRKHIMLIKSNSQTKIEMISRHTLLNRQNKNTRLRMSSQSQTIIKRIFTIRRKIYSRISRITRIKRIQLTWVLSRLSIMSSRKNLENWSNVVNMTWNSRQIIYYISISNSASISFSLRKRILQWSSQRKYSW